MTQSKKNRGVPLPYAQNIVKLHAVYSKALDVDCYRGFARLSDLARISRADEYDENNHLDGIQRELNKRHAREAYDYAANQIPGEKRIWPEVILSLRHKEGVKIQSMGQWKGQKEICPVDLKVDLGTIKLNKIDPTFSRVDGNHRLYYAEGGIDKKHPPLNSIVPFCIIEKVTRDEEVLIFRTINEKQVKLKTDHLLRIKEQTTRGIDLMKKDPVLWLLQQLKEESKSPFYNLIHVAGSKDKNTAYLINQKSLYDGVRILYKALDINLKEEQNLRNLPELLIRFFNATYKRWPNEWQDSKKYLLMTNTGMQALGIVGAQLISRQIAAQRLNEEDFLKELKTVVFSWEKTFGDNKLPTGRSGGEFIAKQILNSMTGTIVDLSKML